MITLFCRILDYRKAEKHFRIADILWRNNFIPEILPDPLHQFRMNRYGDGIFDGSKSIKNNSNNLFAKKIATHLIRLSHFHPPFISENTTDLQLKITAKKCDERSKRKVNGTRKPDSRLEGMSTPSSIQRSNRDQQ